MLFNLFEKEIEVNRDFGGELAKKGLYMIGEYVDEETGKRICIADRHYYEMPHFCKRYLQAVVIGMRDGDRFYADTYAVQKVGRLLTSVSMQLLFRYFLDIDWTCSAEWLVRMKRLGFSVDNMKLISPNGTVFTAEDLDKLF